MLLDAHRDVTAAILLMAPFFAILAKGAFLAIGHHRQTVGVDPQLDQIFLHRFGSLLPENEVIR